MNPLYDAIMPVAVRPDIVFTSGSGSWLTDSHGRQYLDFVQGWAVNGLGHCHPAIVSALQQQCATLINPSPAFYNQPMLELASLLTQNSPFDHVFFTNSGAEANEGAIKLARKWGALQREGAYKIITFDNGFHGRTLATMSASGKAGWEQLFEPKVPGFIKVPFNDIEAVKQAIDSQTVAIMLEPVQGEAGVIPAAQSFVEQLRALTHQHNLLLIFDEVQTGMGRLGSLLACQQYGVEPDILTLGKGIGGGVPLAALLAKKTASCFEPGDQGGTYNGNPLCCAAGLAVLKTVLEPGFLPQVIASGDYLTNGLTTLSSRYGLGEVRGRGLLLALNTASIDARQLVAAALEQGLLINAPRPETLRFMPALTVTRHEIDRMLAILDQVIGSCTKP
ncbi:MAG: acetylornithine aminotransferase [Gammaproteobacteria bacterium BRH_c0]|nr:MAG: acetylornithine aminotransferase [Gammaproteobacteria bacterium BRH_c0]